MALIYTKLTDKTLVLAPREGLLRKFNFGTDWTEMRVGIFCTAVAATGSNDDNVAETLNSGILTDHVTFGIKDDSQTLPGQAGSLFLGVRDSDPDVYSTAPAGGIGQFGGAYRPVGYHGTTEVLGAANSGSGTKNLGAAQASVSSAYCSFTCVKIVISNLGLSTQSATMSLSTAQSVAGTDYSANNLRSMMNAASFGTPLASIAWNDGVAARAIPDCYWIRAPLYNNTLRISAIRAIRYAP